MGKTQKKEHLILYKILFTIGILVAYFVGKSLPLHAVDVSAYAEQGISAEALLRQTISGDIYRCSLFALGVSPYMISSVLVQILSAFRGSEARSRVSPRKVNKLTLSLTFIFAALMAFVQVQELSFTVTEAYKLIAVKIIAGVEMVTGAMMIIWLASRNKKYGIGGQSALILINVLDGIFTTIKGHDLSELAIPLLVAFMAMAVMTILENTEKRIPVQRISIHNIYADKNYLAIKMNPIGVMPAMFSMAFFMIPQLVVSLLLLIVPNQPELLWLQENLALTKPVGIIVYIVILYLLTVGFSRVFVNPGELTDQFLKSGDSIQNVHAGKETKKYLSRTITGLALFSATMMSICLGFPLLLQLTGNLQGSFAALPTSIMMLTGIVCNLGREVFAIKHLGAYKPFI
ncbi:MAG: preprotein translocase subunit SecY [Lachnospiraceae bacterium]|nr:preprotein translocase subunit SecY [Lachnospiraceae bacterium]